MCVHACVCDLGSPRDSGEDLACGKERSAVTDAPADAGEEEEDEEEEEEL